MVGVGDNVEVVFGLEWVEFGRLVEDFGFILEGLSKWGIRLDLYFEKIILDFGKVTGGIKGRSSEVRKEVFVMIGGGGWESCVVGRGGGGRFCEC